MSPLPLGQFNSICMGCRPPQITRHHVYKICTHTSSSKHRVVTTLYVNNYWVWRLPCRLQVTWLICPGVLHGQVMMPWAAISLRPNAWWLMMMMMIFETIKSMILYTVSVHWISSNHQSPNRSVIVVHLLAVIKKFGSYIWIN